MNNDWIRYDGTNPPTDTTKAIVWKDRHGITSSDKCWSTDDFDKRYFDDCKLEAYQYITPYQPPEEYRCPVCGGRMEHHGKDNWQCEHNGEGHSLYMSDDDIGMLIFLTPGKPYTPKAKDGGEILQECLDDLDDMTTEEYEKLYDEVASKPDCACGEPLENCTCGHDDMPEVIWAWNEQYSKGWVPEKSQEPLPTTRYRRDDETTIAKDDKEAIAGSSYCYYCESCNTGHLSRIDKFCPGCGKRIRREP